MPMTIITLSNAPPSLKGDLTKWMQEIATGVFIGNFNSKLREQLWLRIKSNIGNGQATLSYTYRNELGYMFETYQTQRETIDYDGLQLVLFPKKYNAEDNREMQGFSNAYKYNKSRMFNSIPPNKNKVYVVLDLETDGLDCYTNNIIEIGAIKIINNNLQSFQVLIKTNKNIPESITQLTGINSQMLETNGITIEEALNELLMFIDDFQIVGYSVNFDIGFINSELMRISKPHLFNKYYDLLNYVKKDKMFLDNYKLQTVLKEYDINKQVEHRALSDANLIYELAIKVNGFIEFINK